MTAKKFTKLDAGKLPVMRGAFLRFPRAMREIARVSHLGCIKYDAPEGDMNYLSVEEGFGRYTDGLGRHLLAEAIEGKVNIEKGGALPEQGIKVLHAAQAAWNTLARLEHLMVDLEKQGVDVDKLLSFPDTDEPNDPIAAAGTAKLKGLMETPSVKSGPIAEEINRQIDIERKGK